MNWLANCVQITVIIDLLRKKKHTCRLYIENMQSGFLSYIDQLRFKGF